MPNYKLAAEAVTVIMSAYRTNFPNGDEAFAKLAARALEDYDELTLVTLMNPKYGVMAQSKFMPTIAEMREWCDDYRAKRLMPDIGQRITRLPEPPAMSDDERQRMIEKFDALLADLGKSKTV